MKFEFVMVVSERASVLYFLPTYVLRAMTFAFAVFEVCLRMRKRTNKASTNIHRIITEVARN